jgi:hypothetical protein
MGVPASTSRLSTRATILGRFTPPTLAVLVANGCASSRVDSGSAVCITSGTPKASRDWVFGPKRLMSEGSLTGRLSLWRGSWMVASVSP